MLFFLIFSDFSYFFLFCVICKYLFLLFLFFAILLYFSHVFIFFPIFPYFFLFFHILASAVVGYPVLVAGHPTLMIESVKLTIQAHQAHFSKLPWQCRGIFSRLLAS